MSSGADQLGSGKLHAQLENARLEFGPATVNVPGGSANLKLSYEPTVSDVVVGAQIRVDRFDYGILARRIKPDTDLQGVFSLNVDIEGRAPALDAVMAHANGRIDFAVWPKNMRSGIFDLWAVNLFVALAPAVDPAKESKVNCALGRFDLRDGKLTQDAILMDTSRMRVTGEGGADFARESVSLRLAPKPKSAQFFSLATPVQVNGSFTDFKIGVAQGVWPRQSAGSSSLSSWCRCRNSQGSRSRATARTSAPMPCARPSYVDEATASGFAQLLILKPNRGGAENYRRGLPARDCGPGRTLSPCGHKR